MREKMYTKSSSKYLFSISLLIFVFGEMILQGICQERYHSKCFDVDHRNICYFMVNDSRTVWESAWSTCKQMNASLPIISSTNIETVLKNYLRQNVSQSCVWTAGRYIADKQWRWVNGQPLGNDELLRNASLDTRRELNAILNKDLKYEARYWKEENDYICQFSDVHCNSSNAFPWKGGCLVVSGRTLTYKAARNACIEGGGDLATFAEYGKLQLASALLTGRKNYWIGLRQHLLVWNASGSTEDIRYQFLDMNYITNNGCLLFHVPGYRLHLTSCSIKKRFVCQTEYTQSSTEKENTQGLHVGLLAFTVIDIGIVAGSFLLLFVLVSVIVVIWRKIRTKRMKAGLQGDSIDKVYEDLRVHNVGVVNEVPIANVNNCFYTDLITAQLARNIRRNENPFYEIL